MGVSVLVDINLQNKKSLVEMISFHDSELSVVVGDVVFLDIDLHLLLLQKKHQLKLLTVVVPAKDILQYLPSVYQRKSTGTLTVCTIKYGVKCQWYSGVLRSMHNTKKQIFHNLNLSPLLAKCKQKTS